MDKKRSSTSEIRRVIGPLRPTRGLLLGSLIMGALLAFELFNYSTTDFALTDLMGPLRFLNIRWATILALAFCGIDFAGIARLFTPVREPMNASEAGIASLFTPERGTGEPKEVWYLFGAWLLAATMNAMLTWWGVAIAILSHSSLGASVISPDTMVTVVPIFVAIMVWVIRVLIIGSLSLAGNRMFTQAEGAYQAAPTSLPQPAPTRAAPNQAPPYHPIPKPDPASANPSYPHHEVTYHPASMSGAHQNPPELKK